MSTMRSLKELVQEHLGDTDKRYDTEDETLRETPMTIQEYIKIRPMNTYDYFKGELYELLRIVREQHKVDTVSSQKGRKKNIIIRPHVKGLSKTLSRLLVPTSKGDDRGFFDFMRNQEAMALVIRIVSHIASNQIAEMTLSIDEECDRDDLQYIQNTLYSMQPDNEVCEFIQRTIVEIDFGSSIVNSDLISHLLYSRMYPNDVLNTLKLCVLHWVIAERDIQQIPEHCITDADEKVRYQFLQVVKDTWYPPDPYAQYREMESVPLLDAIYESLKRRDTTYTSVLRFIRDTVKQGRYSKNTVSISSLIEFLNNCTLEANLALDIINSMDLTTEELSKVSQNILSRADSSMFYRLYADKIISNIVFSDTLDEKEAENVRDTYSQYADEEYKKMLENMIDEKFYKPRRRKARLVRWTHRLGMFTWYAVQGIAVSYVAHMVYTDYKERHQTFVQ